MDKWVPPVLFSGPCPTSCQGFKKLPKVQKIAKSGHTGSDVNKDYIGVYETGSKGYTIAQWICLRLTSCITGFEFRAQRPWFFQFTYLKLLKVGICDWILKELKWTQKRPWVGSHDKRQYFGWAMLRLKRRVITLGQRDLKASDKWVSFCIAGLIKVSPYFRVDSFRTFVGLYVAHTV